MALGPGGTAKDSMSFEIPRCNLVVTEVTPSRLYLTAVLDGSVNAFTVDGKAQTLPVGTNTLSIVLAPSYAPSERQSLGTVSNAAGDATACSVAYKQSMRFLFDFQERKKLGGYTIVVEPRVTVREYQAKWLKARINLG